MRTERNEVALGSVTFDPALHATEVTKSGDVRRSVNNNSNNPASGAKHVRDISTCVGSRSFDLLRCGRRGSKKGRYDKGIDFCEVVVAVRRERT